MKIPKTLQNFADKNNLEVVPIRYKHQFGYCKRKGFDLIKKEIVYGIDKSREFHEIVLSLEPSESHYKWRLTTYPVNCNGNTLKYFRKIQKAMFKNIDINQKSYMLL
jgi:hypothetical protein